MRPVELAGRASSQSFWVPLQPNWRYTSRAAASCG